MVAMRSLNDAAGTRWAVSEGYTWSPLRQKAPVSYVVFRAGGRELRAQNTPALIAMDDGELAALLAAVQGEGGTRAASAPASAPRRGLAMRSTLLRRSMYLAPVGG